MLNTSWSFASLSRRVRFNDGDDQGVSMGHVASPGDTPGSCNDEIRTLCLSQGWGLPLQHSGEPPPLVTGRTEWGTSPARRGQRDL